MSTRMLMAPGPLSPSTNIGDIISGFVPDFCGTGFGVGLRCRVWGSIFKEQALELGFEVKDLGLAFEVQGLVSGFEVQGLVLRFEVQGLGFGNTAPRSLVWKSVCGAFLPGTWKGRVRERERERE